MWCFVLLDIDECVDPLRCPGQECVNSQGSYRCVSCKPGFDLLNGQCSGNTLHTNINGLTVNIYFTAD